jgi:hypothetical protein
MLRIAIGSPAVFAGTVVLWLAGWL